MNELINKWTSIGLLEGLDCVSDFDKYNLCLKLETAALKIISSTEGYYTKHTELLIFPIIRRVFGGCLQGNEPFRSLNVLQLLEDFNDYSKTDQCTSILSTHNSWSNIDVEVEICRMYSENYRHRHFLNNQIIEPIRFISPHKL